MVSLARSLALASATALTLSVPSVAQDRSIYDDVKLEVIAETNGVEPYPNELVLLHIRGVYRPLINIAHLDLSRGLPPVWFRNVSLLLDVICAWPLYAVLAKRQHDRGQRPILSYLFVFLLLVFSILEAFGLTQDGPDFTPTGLVVGVPLLAVLLIVLADLG